MTDSFSYDQCAMFWRENKIKIKLLNLGQDGYMQNIQAWAYVAIALDILFGIIIFVTTWRQTNMKKIFNESKDEYGPWTFFCKRIKIGSIKCFPGFGKIYFIIFKVILKFGLPMIDTISGECLYLFRFQ